MRDRRGKISRLLGHRETGRQTTLGTADDINKSLYGNIRLVRSWDGRTDGNGDHGAVFNFDFTENGSLCVAACERNSLLVFDPHNGRLIGQRKDAHTDCVNCVRFLDTRLFVTCSDDTNVCLWDVRYLKHQVRVMRGHSNWVKNIEYAKDPGLLLTSGFDGSVYVWDINSDSSEAGDCVFHTEGLMRSKLTPDGSQLLIATRSGYLMLVHDLDLHNLKDDLRGFKPTAHRQWKMDRIRSSVDLSCERVFSRRRNRVELIDDFPAADDAEMIASLEVHPRGWCAVSRHTTKDDNTEMTCIHDIQPSPRCSSSTNTKKVKLTPKNSSSRRHSGLSVHNQSHISPNSQSNSPSTGHSNSQSTSHSISQSTSNSNSPSNSLTDSVSISHSADQSLVHTQSTSQLHQLSTAPDFSDLYRIETKHLAHSKSPSLSSSSSSCSGSPPPTASISTTPKPSPKANRLLHYIEEPNVGRGFIKEQSFSGDGRVISSPFGFGIRILAFNESCSELCDCEPENAVILHEAASTMSHQNVVTTTKFSPVGYFVVTGCLSGKVNFHQPLF